MIKFLFRICLLLIYPVILFLLFLTIYRKNKYKLAIKNNFKIILINTLLLEIIFVIFLFLFLSNEKMIYSWDYSGYWVKSLELRNIFIKQPYDLPKFVFDSFNNSEYSYLLPFFSLPFTIINKSYWFFAIGNFTCFIQPINILLEILYYTYINNKKYLPIFLSVVFYPLYLPILDGKPFAGGIIFIIASYMLLFFQDFEEIDTIDVISINFFSYIAVFERRWYVYSIIGLYLSFAIKYIFSLKQLDNKIKPIFTKLLLSGIILLAMMLFFNMPFIKMVLNSDYKTSYVTAAHSGKLLDFIDRYSIIILLISILGLYKLYNKNKSLFFINVFSIVLTTSMFWYIQAFEDHHYYISMINIIIPFAYGAHYLFNIKILKTSIIILLILQSLLIYTNKIYIPFFTSIKRTQVKLDYVNVYADFCNYLKEIMGEYDTAYICGSSAIFNDDIIRSSILPDIDAPSFEYGQYDLAGGFPNDLAKTNYILLTDPIQYNNKSLQHIHTILNNAILYNDDFKSKYTMIGDYWINNIVVTIYKRTGEYTPDMKLFLYNEIIKYYPNNKDYFTNILN